MDQQRTQTDLDSNNHGYGAVLRYRVIEFRKRSALNDIDPANNFIWLVFKRKCHLKSFNQITNIHQTPNRKCQMKHSNVIPFSGRRNTTQLSVNCLSRNQITSHSKLITFNCNNNQLLYHHHQLLHSNLSSRKRVELENIHSSDRLTDSNWMKFMNCQREFYYHQTIKARNGDVGNCDYYFGIDQIVEHFNIWHNYCVRVVRVFRYSDIYSHEVSNACIYVNEYF